MTTIGYSFEGNFYGDTEDGKQELLEAINEAIETAANADPDLKDATDDERQEAVSMSYDGTIAPGSPWGEMTFWQNCIAIMQHCPYALDIERIDDETAKPEVIAACKEWLDID